MQFLSNLFFVFVILSMISVPGFAAKRTSEWTEVQKAIDSGLPQTAIDKLNPIIDKCIESGKYGEAALAISKKIILEGNIQGNKAEEKIVRLEKEIPKLDKSMHEVMKCILARWYWHYFQQNNWRFLNRTATAGLDEKDFTTWDLPKLFGRISALFDETLQNESVLQQISIDDFSDLLENGNQPVQLRPTLYDFLAHQALEFYMSGEQASALPQDSFELNSDSPVLQHTLAFIDWEIKTSDTSSPKYKALKLFQNLAKFHTAKKNVDGLLDVEIKRIQWAANVCFGEDRKEKAVDILRKLADENSNSSLSSLALAKAASLLVQLGKTVEAYNYAKEGAERYPNSDGGSDCKAVINELQTKDLEISTDRVAGKPLPKIKLNYRNIDTVYFRAVPFEWKKLFSKNRYNPDYIDYDERNRILKMDAVKEWKVSLTPTDDFKTKEYFTEFPQLKPGFYFLVCSHSKSFSLNNNAVRMTGVWVSSLAIVSRDGAGKRQGFVLDNETGEPIPGATVDAMAYDYDKGWKKIGSVQTDDKGFYTVEKSRSILDYFRSDTGDSTFLAVVQAKGEALADSENRSSSDRGTENVDDRTVFFTDRAIYRPGQTIHFKGIVVRVDPENNTYKTIPGRLTVVSFRDANGQEIASQNLTANDFGSFSGTFTAPAAGRLLGQMSIQATPEVGQAYFRVEEYKRPKFKVSLEQPKDGGKLGEEVTLEGEAMAYSGAPIDKAKVKFRVQRLVRMPWWCWWYTPIAQSQEIAHGKVETDTSGKFKVSFIALPDKSVPEVDQPSFIYTVSTDVTDGTGETISAEQSIRLGYTALEIDLNVKEWCDTEQPVSFDINTKTFDGKGVPANGNVTVFSLVNPEAPERAPLEGVNSNIFPTSKWATDTVVAEMPFNSGINGNASVTLNIKPGAYRIFVNSRDRYGKEVTAQKDFIALDPTNKSFNVAIPSLFIVKTPSVEPGEIYRALWGTGYKAGRAWIELEKDGKVQRQYWTKENETQHLFEFPVEESHRGGFIVRVVQVRENRLYVHQSNVEVPYSNKQMNISFEHFTSKMQPGQKDTWTVAIKGPGAEMKAVEMVAALYDASLDAFAMHGWPTYFAFFKQNYSNTTYSFANRLRTWDHLENSWNTYCGYSTRTYHQFPSEIIQNFFGYGYMESDMLECSMADGPGGGGMIKAQRSRGPMEEKMKKCDLAMDKESNEGMSAPAPMASAVSGEPAPEQRAEGGNKAPADHQAPKPDLSKVSARTNLNETAFFFPHLKIETDGTVKINFTIPEALTTWKFLGFAHGEECESGGLTATTITQKDLMVQPNPPRFLREGDSLLFTAKITNLSDQLQKGVVKLSLFDPISEKERNSEFDLTSAELEFDVPAKESKSFEWKIKVPDTPGIVGYKVVAASDKFSDGEAGQLPLLSRRILVREAMPLPIRGPETKKFRFNKLADSGKSDTLKHESLTVQVTSNPAWYAVQALPYLMEFPYECSEQIFNRLYANSLAKHIAASDPKIKRVFAVWKAEEAQGGKALLSNLEKNEDLKNVLLMETPWVCDAKNETEAKHKVGMLFDDMIVKTSIANATDKLKKLQLGSGGFSWFPGGPPDEYITLYIVTGFGRLKHLKVDVDTSLAMNALNYLDNWVNKIYQEILRHGHIHEMNINSTIAMYLYGRSFYLKDRPIPDSAKTAVDYFLGQGKEYWLKLDSKMAQGHLALAESRFGDKTLPKGIYASLKERSVTDPELGRFWRDEEYSFYWYRAPIETQALMIEVFDEIAADSEGVEDLKVWLLKQKQTQDWKTTKATADAIYALLLRGADLLASDKLVKISLGEREIQPEKVEAGTGFYEKRFSAAEVVPAMGEIVMTKEDKGVAWGGIHWQYLEDMSKVTPHETNLKLKKTLFVKQDTKRGPEISPVKGALKVGDLLTVRIELRTDRDMEYIHMKDMRGSGMEPIGALSEYRYQDGLGYYQSPRDTATHFFISYLPKGTYVFEYDLRVVHRGHYQTGMAEIQCMYAPEFSSHSESFWVDVE
ncbi:MAG: hypothetical protein HQM10_22905 [Candidatus Riflebacteria bacterium]|nr:hypothetical protein [Candidatus Riflebacteria bacterium]